MKIGDRVKFKNPFPDEVGVIFLLISDPLIQSAATQRGECPARADIKIAESDFTFPPIQCVNLSDIEPE